MFIQSERFLSAASGSSGLDHIVRPGGLKDGVNNKKLNEGIEGLEE